MTTTTEQPPTTSRKVEKWGWTADSEWLTDYIRQATTPEDRARRWGNVLAGALAAWLDTLALHRLEPVETPRMEAGRRPEFLECNLLALRVTGRVVRKAAA